MQPGWNMISNQTLWKSEQHCWHVHNTGWKECHNHWLTLDSFPKTFTNFTKTTSLCTHSPSTPTPTASSHVDSSLILAAALMRATKHKESSSPGPGPELCLRVWSQRVSCLAFTTPAASSSFVVQAPLALSDTRSCGSAFIPKERSPTEQDLCMPGGNLPLSLAGVYEGYLPVCTANICPNPTIIQVNRKAPLDSYRPWLSLPWRARNCRAKNRVTQMTQLSPHPHPPPAPPGHSSGATGRCLHHCPIDTGQSSRKPSKSWVEIG